MGFTKDTLPDELTPAVMAYGTLMYVCKEGWSTSSGQAPAPWGPEDAWNAISQVDTLLAPIAQPRQPGWYEVTDDEATRALWWDGSGWIYYPDGVAAEVDEESSEILRLVVEGEDS